MPITWNSDAYVKLLAAMLAAHPEFKPNLHSVAIYYGDGATYDAIQGALRPIRRRAQDLQNEISTGVRPNVLPTPKKKRPNAVGSGSVGASGGGSTAKARKGAFSMGEVEDDEEMITPTKKRTKISDGTPGVTNSGLTAKLKNAAAATGITPSRASPAGSAVKANMGRKIKGTPSVTPTPSSTVIDLIDSSDDEDAGGGGGSSRQQPVVKNDDDGDTAEEERTVVVNMRRPSVKVEVGSRQTPAAVERPRAPVSAPTTSFSLGNLYNEYEDENYFE